MVCFIHFGVSLRFTSIILVFQDYLGFQGFLDCSIFFDLESFITLFVTQDSFMVLLFILDFILGIWYSTLE